jgi:transglutaminase-like putative cysteine protease
MRRLYYSVLLFTILFVSVSSDAGVKRNFLKKSALSKLPPVEQYAKWGGVVLQEESRTQFLTNDGLSQGGIRAVIKRHYNWSMMYASEQADTFLTQKIYMNAEDDLVEFSARIVKPNGDIITSLNRSDLREVQIAPDYITVTDNQSYEFTFSGVKPGYVVEYHYIKNTRERILGSHTWRIQERLPKLYTSYTVEVPEIYTNSDYTWNFVPVNIDLPKPKVKPVRIVSSLRDDMGYAYSWELQDVPALENEYRMPSHDEIAWHLETKLQRESWDNLTSEYWNSIRDKFQPVDVSRIAQLVEEITAGAESDEERIQKLYNYVLSEYEYFAIDIDDSGYIPHQVDEIIASKKGDCKDMSVLLCVLLRIAGYDAYPALVKTSDRGQVNQDIVFMDFNHMIVYAENDDGSEYWLDGTGSFCPINEEYPSIEGTTPLVIFEDDSSQFKEIPLSRSFKNTVFRHITLDLTSEGRVTGVANLLFTGNKNLSIRSHLIKAPAEKRDQLLRNLAGFIHTDATIDSMQSDGLYTLSSGFHASIYFSIDQEVTEKPGSMIMQPALFRLTRYPEHFKGEERTYPIKFSQVSKSKDLVDINYDPDRLKPESLPDNVMEQYRFGYFACEVTQPTPGKISFARDYSIESPIILAEEYAQYQSMNETYQKSDDLQIVFIPEN